MEDTQFKSPLFDATATWNGFSYQGKVGLYVCLKLINDALLRNEDIDEFCEQYSIEFEWLEDFSILKNDQYISHHQVKHYNDDKFSSYIDAIVTILARQQGRISENDLFKYISYYAQGSTKEFNKKGYIEKLVSRLIEENVVDQHRFIIANNLSNLDGYNDDVVTAVNNYLDDFITIKDQYLNGCVYVHTSKKIITPNKDLSAYKDIKKSKVSLEHGSKRTLKSQNIICSFDSNSDYELAFDDAELTKKLIFFAESILQHHKSTHSLTPEILTIYVASIKDRIDKYVEQRHEDLRRDETISLSEIVKRKLMFTEILTCLRTELIDESNDDYWELICRENFENAFQKQIDFLDEENLVERRNLYRHYKTTYDKYIKQGKLTLLLKALKPHLPVCNNASKSNYYHQHIASENDISIAYLSFLENLNIEHDDCFFFPKNGKYYHASTISVNHSIPRHTKKAIETLKVDFKERYIYLNKDTDFIVIDSPNNTEFSGRLDKFVEVPNVLDYEVTEKKHITSTKDLTFVHYELAQEKLNE
ncbi:TPA: hypothetical protein NJ331_004419 [Vibrio parahaemolyticus]|nr:hypothetical protein [Vibrio parahaemolyticus]HCM1306290.1 hypothetical protein [Vibrio parahaemolyticus]